MNPGLLPVLWIDVPPAAHAASTRARTSGSRLAGWWNSPRVVTMLAPDLEQPAHLVEVAALRHVEDAVRLERQDVVDVVGREDAGRGGAASSPASSPTLSGEWTCTPTRSRRGMLDDPAQRRGCRCCRSPTAPRGTWPARCRRSSLDLSVPLTRGERGLVEHVGGQAHVGGVDQPTVAPDGADARRPRPRGRSRSTRSASAISSAVGANTSLAMAIWLGVDGPLPVEAEQAGVRRRSAVAVGILVRGVGRVDGVDARRPGRGEHLDAGEVPEVAGVLAAPGRSCRRPGRAARPTGRRRRR